MCKNSIIKENLINEYLESTGGNYIIIPEHSNGVISAKVIDLTFENIDILTGLDIDSKNKKSKLRGKKSYKAFNSIKALSYIGLEFLESDLEAEFKANKVAKTGLNRGNLFEKRIKEFFGQEFHLDNKSHKLGGDLELDGVQYQIKYYRFSM